MAFVSNDHKINSIWIPRVMVNVGKYTSPMDPMSYKQS